MIWNSWSDFFAMGGYGLYVWGSVVVTFGLMFGELLLLATRWNVGIKHLGNWIRNVQKERHENKI
jgi:heme exporter protein D